MQLFQRFGIGHVIDVLRGADTERIRSLGHDSLSTYGIGASLTKDAWGNIFRQLIHLGYLQQDMGNYAVLRLMEKATSLLRGQERIMLARLRPTFIAARRESKARVLSMAQKEGAEPHNEGLFQELRALRKKLAAEQRVPSYVVFSDASLRDMASRAPTNLNAFSAVNGVGKRKLDRYGAVFIAAIREFLGEKAEDETPGTPSVEKTVDAHGDDWQVPTGKRQELNCQKGLPARAYAPWTGQEDDDLRRLHVEGRSVGQMASHFNRKPGAISSRLVKLGLT